MPKADPRPIEELARNLREEFTSLNLLVQALNRELRDHVLTTLQEVKHIGRKLRVAPRYGEDTPTASHGERARHGRKRRTT